MLKITSLLFALIILSGCVLTKVVTVPMRITGAVISVIPVVGESVDAVIDQTADAIDLIPI
ncbi:MAG TPA: hypothetical protein EYI82_02530 [Gammaproteobacteria bacterium]|jgi:hypothetical protein|nr:hypothetical protein [Gammaproteobacteria bacterium]